MELTPRGAELVHTVSDWVVLAILVGTCVAAVVFYFIFKGDLDIRE